ncbi:hypothetical protein F2P56_003313 [Juglans regia]|uniref:Uridine kinase n=1 Tax=Juglans regia TaxID=51240 RepID=A0A833Y4H6_JUGRE|nr:hypothetical protein F2P56_003313 [Juglans regia]
MAEETTTPSAAMEYPIEAASGVHFSGLRPDGLLISPASSPASSSSQRVLSSFPASPGDLSAPHKQPFVIGVSGGTASGKTTVCDMIIQQLHDHRVVLVNQDSFYRGLTDDELKHVHEYNFDHPDAFDTEQLLECIGKLKSGQPVQVPIYNFKDHRRCSDSFRQVNATDVIILEGILVFHDQRVRNLMNMKIFVDADADTRLARRIKRDTVERSRDVHSVLEQYSKFVKPAFDNFILPSKKYADVIIPRGGENHVAIDLIVQHIRTKLGQHNLCKIYPNLNVILSTFQDQCILELISARNYVVYPLFEVERAWRTHYVHAVKELKLEKSSSTVQLIYEKLPKDISQRHVLLMDPVLATGNSAIQAIGLLVRKGVPESQIIFLNLISAPEGIHRVYKQFPSLKIVTSEIDVALNDEFHVVPGMGDFGDRYFGTDDV